MLIRKFLVKKNTVMLLRNMNFRYYNKLNQIDDIEFSQINVCKNLNELDNLYNEMKQNLNPFHSIYLLKAMFKFLNKGNVRDNQPKIESFLDDINKNFKNFGHSEYVDILFVLRKCYSFKIRNNIDKENVEILYSQINININDNIYGLKILSNIWFDFSIMRKNNEFICEKILENLKSKEDYLNFNLLPIIFVKLILSAYYSEKRGNKLRDLINYILIKNSDKILSYDLEQKIYLFKFISKLNWHLMPPLYKSPNCLNNLKNDLLEQIEELKEESYLDIVDAYEFLPIDFSNELLSQIRTIIINSLTNNDRNLSNQFLINFYKLNEKINKKKLYSNQKKVILNELLNRLDNGLIERKELLEILNFHQDSHIVPDLFTNIIKHIKENNQINLNLRFILLLKKIDEDFENNYEIYTEKIKNLPNSILNKIIISQLLVNKEIDVEELKKEIEEINNLKYILMKSEELGNEVIEILFENFLERVKDLNDNDKYYISVLFLKYKNFNNESYLKLINNMDLTFENDNFIFNLKNIIKHLNFSNHKIIKFILDIYERNVDTITFDNLFDLFLINKELMIKLNNNYSSYLLIIYQAFSKSISNVNKPSYFNNLNIFVNRLINLECNEYLVCLFYSKVLSSELNNSNIIVSKINKQNMITKLINNDLINYKVLEKYYLNINKNKDNYFTNEIEIISKYYQYNMNNENKNNDEDEESNSNEELNNIIDKIIKNNINKLDSTNPKMILNAIIIFLKFPKEKISSFNILSLLKENIGFINYNIFLKLISSISPNIYNKNAKFYYPIVNELLKLLPQYLNYMRKNDIIFILNKVSLIKYNNKVFFNELESQLIEKIKYFKDYDLYILLKSLLNSKFYNEKIYNAVLNKLNIYNYNIIFKILYLSNIKLKQKHSIFDDAFKNIKSLNTSQIINYIIYKTLNLENIQRENEDYLLEIKNKINTMKDSNYNAYLNKTIQYYIYSIYENIDKEGEIFEFIKKNFDDYGILKDSIQQKLDYHEEPINYISLFLKLLNLEVEKNPLFNDNQVKGLYLPEHNIFINVLFRTSLLIDQEKINSEEELKIKYIYSLKDDIKIINVKNDTFKSITDNINKIEYLNELGVPNQNQEGIYDFNEINKLYNTEALDTNIKDEEEDNFDNTDDIEFNVEEDILIEDLSENTLK